MIIVKEYTSDEWFELGKYHSSLKNSRNAINCYNECILQNPRHFKAWSNMAAEFFQMKLYQKSIECCKEAIRINQHDKNAWLTLAANFFQINDDGKASFCFHRASVLGSKKAQRFLEKAKKVNDKILHAEMIDVSSEIFEIKHEEINEEKVQQIDIYKEDHIPTAPNPNEKGFIEKLGAFLLEIGNSFIIKSGGLISIIELYSFIKANYPRFDVKPNDILKALKDLEKKKMIEGLKTLENSNIIIIEFIPRELSSDIKIILEMALKRPYLTYDDIISQQSWDNYRIGRALKFLESKNLAKKVGSYLKGEKWYFPYLSKEY